MNAETISVDMSRQSNVIRTIKDKSIIHVLKIEPMEAPQEVPVEPDPVDWHEGDHIAVGLYAGVPIKYASSIATAEYEGVTIPSRYYAPMAAAGGATEKGGGGDDHDRMIIRMHGDDPDSAKSVARSILRSIPKQRRALAEGLKKNGILHSHEINWIYKNAGNEDEDQNKVKETMYMVFVKGKGGEVREEVVLPEDQPVLNISLPQSGDIFVAAERKISLAP
jgi:hypothetical protein